MALLRGLLRSRELNTQVLRILKGQSSRQCHWFPYYKPGPFPKTKEERATAAKKYNMLPEEYEPYPDDGLGYGDYPNLPYESVDAKDDYYAYDDIGLRRDYLDPVPIDAVILLPEHSSTKSNPIPWKLSILTVFGPYLLICGIILWSSDVINLVPVSAPQRVDSGVTHYTFELDYEEDKKRRIKCECPEKTS